MHAPRPVQTYAYRRMKSTPKADVCHPELIKAAKYSPTAAVLSMLPTQARKRC